MMRAGWRRRAGAVAALLAAVLLTAAPAAAGIADQVGATFGLMLQDVVAAFPAVEGLVLAVDGDRLFLDLTERDGVRPGQEFTIFRKGDVFRHPVTGQRLGRFEDTLGHARVKQVQAGFSEAVLVPANGSPGIRPEDGVRITRGRLRVAVPPAVDLTRAQADLRRVPYMLAFGLDQTKRFQSSDPAVVRELLLNQHTKVEELLVRPERVVALSRALEVSGWLIPVLIERGNAIYLDVTWISGVTGMPLFSRRLSLVRAESATEQRFPWEPRAED
ncbi:MAG: FlgT C-terminal domain-containing protein [Candidatus Rokuibacteriota bacterium]